MSPPPSHLPTQDPPPIMRLPPEIRHHIFDYATVAMTSTFAPSERARRWLSDSTALASVSHAFMDDVFAVLDHRLHVMAHKFRQRFNELQDPSEVGGSKLPTDFRMSVNNTELMGIVCGNSKYDLEIFILLSKIHNLGEHLEDLQRQFPNRYAVGPLEPAHEQEKRDT